MGCGNPVGLRMPLGIPVLDALSMTGVAIQTLFGMWVRQKVLHGFGVTHFAEVMSFLVCKDGLRKEENEKKHEEQVDLLALRTASL